MNCRSRIKIMQLCADIVESLAAGEPPDSDAYHAIMRDAAEIRALAERRTKEIDARDLESMSTEDLVSMLRRVL